jgi:hypothetical protein
MVRSPHSRGKGNRRWPGRPGGARKRKPAGPWERRCQHIVADPLELTQPIVALWYVGKWGADLEHRAYVFDQEMARLGIRYYAKLGIHFRRRALLISVSELQAAQVAEVIANMELR